MAILDTRSQFCDATALNTGVAGTYLIGDVMDLGNVRDIGGGHRPLYCVAVVTTTCTSGGAATLQLKLSSDAAAAIATDGSATDHIVFPQFAVANLTAGTILGGIQVPMEGNAYERYLGILQITGTAAFTAGAIDVFLTTEFGRIKHYPNAVV